MVFEPEKETSSELDLSLFSISIQPPEPPGALTPPLRTAASIPFQWEEAPGKPRHCNTESKPHIATTLELPPRLLTEAKFNLASTTVLDHVPEMGRSLFVTYSFRSPEDWGKKIIKNSRVGYFGSNRWGSFGKSKDVVVGDISSSSIGCESPNDGESKVKITRVRRRRSSFLDLSPTKSHLLVSQSN